MAYLFFQIFSENRRHIVLSKPDSTHDEIDDILRHKWEALSKKEKLRYFIRAKNAIKDENRHSNRNHVGKFCLSLNYSG